MSNSMSNRVGNKSWVSDGMSNRMCDNSRSILRNSLVGYILNNTITIVSILDCLNSTIRKSDSVTPGGGVTISVLSLLEVSSTVVIINTILVCIYWGFRYSSSIGRSCYQGSCRGCSSNSKEGSSNNNLHAGS